MQHGEAVRRGGLDDRQPQRPAADPGALPDRVDLDVRHGGRADDHDIVEPAQRPGVVPGALRGNPQPGGHGCADDLGGLLGVGRVGHGGRALVDSHIPGHPGLVESGVTGQVHCASTQSAQGLGAG